MGHQHQVRIVDRRDAGEIARQRERLAGQQRFIHGVRVGHQQQRVAVGRGLGNDVGADHRAAAGLVVDDEALAQRLLQPLREKAGVVVGRAAGGEGHDDADRPVGIALGQRGAAKHGQAQRR